MNIRRWTILMLWGMAAVILGSGLMMNPSAFAQEFWETSQELIEPQANGTVNWSSGSLVAKGIGIPPEESSSSSAANAMAARAAKVVALRNLLELVQGVRVDSTTTVNNYMVQFDVIQTRVKGVVRNAQETKRAVFPDGSVEVTVSMELWGDHSLLSSLSPLNERNRSSGRDSSEQNAMGYSGVVLDARGLSLNPVAFPSLLDPERQSILSTDENQRLKGQIRGGAQYFKLKESLLHSRIWGRYFVLDKKETGPSLKRVGPRPLTIKGLSKAGAFQADIIVSATDAQKIREDESLLQALRNGRIIIVTDPLIAGIEGNLPGSTVIMASKMSF